MAKTIKEMAIEYGKVNYIVRYTADGEREIDEETGAEFFEDGANAVLEEIEDILYRRYSDDGDPRQRWIDMNKLCKELKGE